MMATTTTMTGRPQPYSHDLFGYKAEVFSAEVSQCPLWQLYPGIWGFEIVSPKGVVLTYIVAEEIRNGERELMYYVLRPTPETCRFVPGAAKTRVMLFND